MTSSDIHTKAQECTRLWAPELADCVDALDDSKTVPSLVSKPMGPQALTLISLYGLLARQGQHQKLLRILQLTVAEHYFGHGGAALAMCYYKGDLSAQEDTVTWRIHLDGDGFVRITSVEYGGYTAQWEYELHSDWKLNGVSATNEQLSFLDNKVSSLHWTAK